MHRTVVLGGPRVGKTTLSRSLAADYGVAALHTDDLIGSSDPEATILGWMAQRGPWVIEGVTAVRALRTWLRAHSAGLPCDRAFWSESPKVDQTTGQARMAKGCRTVWQQVESELRDRGATIQLF